MRAITAITAIAMGAACRDPAPPPPRTRTTLADYLATIAGTDEATRTVEIATWKLDRPAWERTVVATYRGVATSGPCIEVGWVIAEAALRADPARFTHACSLASNLCVVVSRSP